MDEQNWMHEYRTGRTRPAKSHNGLIAVLLIAVIFLGGIVSALSLLNIRLFQKLEQQPDSIRFTPMETEAGTSAPTSAGVNGQISLDLQDSPQSVENIPQEGGLSLQEIYKKAIGSVVSISCITENGSSSGTGVVIDKNGYLLTNAHVVANAVSILITLSDGRELTALPVGSDEISDLAVLQVEADDLIPAQFGDSSVLQVGDLVVAIGDPLGAKLRGTMTDGIVSAINRDIVTDGRTMTLIQTNAALNSGNSGGPLLNCYGQVIGINTLKIGDYVNSAGVEGLGFAIPSVTVKEIVDQLLQLGYVEGRPDIGMQLQELSRFEQQFYGLPQGLYISQVAEGSSAAELNIAQGDVLVSFDGTELSSLDTLRTLLYAHEAGDEVDIVIFRGGTLYKLKLTLDQAQ